MGNIYHKIIERIQKGYMVCLKTEISAKEGRIGQELNKTIEDIYKYSKELDNTKKFDHYYIEPVVNAERLIICGGGHISTTLADFAAKTGYKVIVIDDREDFANEQRFPMAMQVICDDYIPALEKVGVQYDDYVVIVTRGHIHDGDCLKYIIQKNMPHYVGMIGSKKRVGDQFQMFISDGIEEEKLNKVATPIGLDIGAVSPQEIAVAVLAELICCKRKTVSIHQQSDLDFTVIKEIAACKEPAAIATIMEATGSTPIGKGSKMLVNRSGIASGTIGGGKVEIDAIKKAQKIIGTGRFLYYTFSMDGDIALDEGMACGGSVDILIEDLVHVTDEKN